MTNQSSRFDALGVVLYVSLCVAGAWLLSLPLWLNPAGLKHWSAQIILPAMMLIPAGVTALMVLIIRPEPDKRRELGLGFGRRGWWRYWLFAWLVVPGFAIAAPFVSAALGLYTLDLREFSGFREIIEARGGGAGLTSMPVQVLVLAQLLVIPLAPPLNAIFAFGEELGWRGYLLPRLRPLGRWPALLMSGAIWGLWHAPVILLGYNYPAHPTLGVLVMMCFCVVFGIIFGWTRLSTGSIWPAVIGHGALNGSAATMFLFAKAGTSFDSIHAGITGWTGWILPVLWILFLIFTGRLPVKTLRFNNHVQPRNPAAHP